MYLAAVFGRKYPQSFRAAAGEGSAAGTSPGGKGQPAAVTATQAARSFASILDAVEHGETVVITRDNAGVLIAIERGRLDVDAVLGVDDAAIASITAMELLVGVERADEAHRQARAIRVEAILSSLPVEPYNVGVAQVHARLAVEAMAQGRARSANDMMIAATAASTSRILLTTDASASFDQLTGVRAEVLKLP